MVTANNLDAGDGDRYRGQTITLDSGSNTVNDGDAVEFDGASPPKIQQATGNASDYVGVVLPEDKSNGDSYRTVHVAGHIVAIQLDSSASVSAGDTLIPSSNTNGEWEGASAGMKSNTDNTDEDLYLNHPFALEDGGNDEVILACFR